MDKHQLFAAKLKRILQSPPYSNRSDIRPFVCDGYPLDCEAFVVGINPATVTHSFLNFYDRGGDGRFDMMAFRRCYGGNLTKGARPRLDCIQRSASPVRILQTNLWAYECLEPQTVPLEFRRTDLFEFLLNELKPKALLVHGRDALVELRNVSAVRARADFDFGFADSIKTDYSKDVWCRITKHLSRNGSYLGDDSNAAQWGREIHVEVTKRRSTP